MDELRRSFEKHEMADDQRFSSLDTKLSVIKDNHLYHIEKDVAVIAGGMKSLHEKLDENSKETTENKTNIGWMKWIITAVGGAVIVQVVLLWFK